jgi:hypothetical protein
MEAMTVARIECEPEGFGLSKKIQELVYVVQYAPVVW